MTLGLDEYVVALDGSQLDALVARELDQHLREHVLVGRVRRFFCILLLVR